MPPAPRADAAPPDAWYAVARTLLGEPELTSAEVAARSGSPLEELKRLWAALGLPPVPDDEPAFTAADVEVVRAVRSLAAEAGGDPAVVVQVARVIGRAMAQIADAVVGAVAERAADDPASRVEAALGERVEALGPAVEPFLAHVWRHHLLAALLRAIGSAQAGAADDHVQVVGFADLVGFTALTQQLDAAELTRLVDRFEALAYERIVARGGRVVKMIGDEVMFAAEDAVVATEIALALVEASGDDASMPPLRVGLALGPTLPWEGDLFGSTVNLASRLVAIARPGTVLASEEVGEQLADHGFVLHHLRPLRLKGIGRVRFWVIRRGGVPGEAAT